MKVGSGENMQEGRFFNLFNDHQFQPIMMSAGESISIVAEWNWSDRTGTVPNDWSIVALGELGNVSVTHDEGIASDSLPFIAKQ